MISTCLTQEIFAGHCQYTVSCMQASHRRSKRALKTALIAAAPVHSACSWGFLKHSMHPVEDDDSCGVTSVDIALVGACYIRMICEPGSTVFPESLTKEQLATIEGTCRHCSIWRVPSNLSTWTAFLLQVARPKTGTKSRPESKK
jgi:hypothetical protein